MVADVGCRFAQLMAGKRFAIARIDDGPGDLVEALCIWSRAVRDGPVTVGIVQNRGELFIAAAILDREGGVEDVEVDETPGVGAARGLIQSV